MAWPQHVLTLPGSPSPADVASIPALGITAILADVVDPAVNLFNAVNINRIATALSTGAGVGIDGFVDAVARVVGFQPVPQKTPRSTADGAIDERPEGYIGVFLDWGNVNRVAFNRVVCTVFNNYLGQMRANVAGAVAGNVRVSTDVTARAKQYVATHPPTQVFEKYLTPVPVPSPLPASPFMMTLPTYDVRQIAHIRQAGNGISNYRKRAMQRGFYRMERLNTAMIWMDHIGDEMRAAKAAIAGLNIVAGDLTVLRGAGTGAGAPANSILAYLFEAPAPV